MTAIAAGSAAGVPLLLQTCARECALYALLAPDGPAQADRVLAGYFGHETAARSGRLRRAFPDLGADALRTIVMTDERYVVRTERLADAQAEHAPVWRSRYDGPYTGLEDDPDPAFAQYAPLLIARRTAATRSASGRAASDLSAALHATWGALATTGDPGWAPYASARAAGDDLRPGRPARRGGPVRGHPRHLVRPQLAARHLVDNRRSPDLTAAAIA